MIRFSLLSIFFISSILNTCYSQDSTKVKKVKILPVPAFGYSPETRTYIGAVSLFTFNIYNDTLTRISNAKMEFNYTWNKQIIADIGWNLFFKEESWFSKGEIYYSKFPDFYYGIGTNTPDSNKLTFNSNRFLFDVSALKKIDHRLFTGLNIKYIDYSKVEPTGTSNLNYSELTDQSTIGIGYSILKDSRNNILTPISGMYAFANATYNISTSNYLELFFDLRYYKTWNQKFTLAGRLINDFNFGSVPFFDNAVLGGDKFVRGYYYGRYRDKKLSSLQMEFRFPIYWRIGLTTFGGISNLYPDFSMLNLTNTKYNGGIGFRFLVDKKDKTNLRFDYAVGSHQNDGFYISFGESF